MKLSKVSLYILFLFVVGCNDTNNENPIIVESKPYGEFIDDWTFKVFPKSGDNFNVAEFRLWVPDNIENLKAILILIHSYNSNGLGLALSNEWQEYAISENLGILAVHLKSYDNTFSYYAEAFGGSGIALVKSLDTLAYKNNINKISSLPFLMRGYSAGGVFSYSFSEFMPERVISFVNIRGGNLDVNTYKNNKIPSLMLAGENDNPLRNQIIKNIVLSKRNQGGNWGFAIELNADHFSSLTNSDNLVRAFFSSVLKKRLSNESNQLITVIENSGWLGNNVNKKIFPFISYPDIKNEASWLIDEDFAIHWRNFQLE